MGKQKYDQIGKGYNSHRKADPRLVDALISHLNACPNHCLLELGAGTGNYARAIAAKGFFVKALEPSLEMRSQAVADDRVQWLDGVAEQVPLLDGAVDGVYAVLALHHFTDRQRAFAEAHRVCPGGRVAVFTFDPRTVQGYWFPAYFPEIWSEAFGVFPAAHRIAEELEGVTGRSAMVQRFPISRHFSDRFMGADWAEPSAYLDPLVRASMSGFALADQANVQRGVEQLRADIESGAWQLRYGAPAEQEAYDVGYYFVTS